MMYSRVLRDTAVLALVALGIAVSAEPNISVKISGQHTVNGVENFIVNTTVINNGKGIVTLLNYPGSPLSNLPSETFKITHANGDTPAFVGIRAKYVPAQAIAAGKDAVTILAPGQFVEVEHDLSKAYAFDKEGEYNVVSNNHFYFVNAQQEAASVYATTEDHTARLTGKITIRRSTLVERFKVNGCTAVQEKVIKSSVPAAVAYVNNALAYLEYNSTTERDKTWFGEFRQNRYNIVTHHFGQIANNSGSFQAYLYDCSCNEDGVFAYVYPDRFGVIYLCPLFWKAPITGTDSKAGTLVHEASHFNRNGGTQDYAYSQQGAKQLAITDPDLAIANADNHEYFAENNPPLA